MNFIKRHLKPHQQVALTLYPITVLVAFLYSTLGNPPNTYYAHKHNVLNLYFVKIGWVWVTLVYFSYLYFVRSRYLQDTQRFIKGSLRYLLVTLYWYIMTQWLLGPSMIDRIYVLTGGQCRSLTEQADGSDKLTSVVSQQVCRHLGGHWAGGHDVSGHCVLLIHASLFLWEELCWMFYSFDSLSLLKKQDKTQYRSVMAVLTIAVIWWFMLFQTGIYFHGHYELLSGTFFGTLGWVILYLGVFPRIPEIGNPSPSLVNHL
ncbi:hypothetical protein G6F57_011864 [Rhizopus arrhizus]|uniref:Uncharacterized protein n=1 Tax=Rhizopus oryzae TaxID=64495 RepID=A0A9P7BM94_RHIOR|nr:hypothetical protein G6F23_009120 [Rhizopus arrhizus]KAG1405137.1 hypothetical protein G6F58_010069 [Rhizopus delemar]KAG0763256.1 hypothetical protein G6F24_006168 [Rhizopus arrhizus]KAG0781936.1 hypothetical protein G6F21_011384 [Rhizopus arrhizus]KAG0786456.1 hypothetical protein G6F22_007622 [Rhizopus arrhizus]